MTILVAAPEPAAMAVTDTLADRNVRTVPTLAAAVDSLDESTLAAVLVAPSLPDGNASDLLRTVRTGERCSPRTPVIELTGVENAEHNNATEDDSLDSNPTRSGEPTVAFDDRVPVEDPTAIEEAISFVVAIDAYREALDRLYERCRERPTDSDRIDSARETARERLEAVQRLAGDRTPFDRLLSK